VPVPLPPRRCRRCLGRSRRGDGPTALWRTTADGQPRRRAPRGATDATAADALRRAVVASRRSRDIIVDDLAPLATAAGQRCILSPTLRVASSRHLFTFSLCRRFEREQLCSSTGGELVFTRARARAGNLHHRVCPGNVFNVSVRRVAVLLLKFLGSGNREVQPIFGRKSNTKYWYWSTYILKLFTASSHPKTQVEEEESALHETPPTHSRARARHDSAAAAMGILEKIKDIELEVRVRCLRLCFVCVLSFHCQKGKTGLPWRHATPFANPPLTTTTNKTKTQKRNADEPHPEKQGDGGPPGHPEVQARQAPHAAPGARQDGRQHRGRRLRGVQVRPRARRAHRLPLRRQVHPADARHGHRLRGRVVVVHSRGVSLDWFRAPHRLSPAVIGCRQPVFFSVRPTVQGWVATPGCHSIGYMDRTILAIIR
jgi:hypothetical protein